MKCKKAKEKHMSDQSEELESLPKRDVSLMYNKMRTVYKRKTRAAKKCYQKLVLNKDG